MTVLARPPALVANAEDSRFYRIVHRVADRFGPAVAAAFVLAVEQLQGQIDASQLEQLIATANVDGVIAAVNAGTLAQYLAGPMEAALTDTVVATGTAGAEMISEISGVDYRFNWMDPGVTRIAREQTATRVASVTDDVVEAIRIIIADGTANGKTAREMAGAIKHLVGLPPNWVEAPLRMADELASGSEAVFRRRLSAEDKRIIRSMYDSGGEISEDFIREMQRRYAKSLIDARADNIARTETLQAGNDAQREGWKQAVAEGALPDNVRRVAIVTPDDRLRETHAAIPGMNPNGVGLTEKYKTPFGRLDGPPWEPQCRCSEGLLFPTTGAVL